MTPLFGKRQGSVRQDVEAKEVITMFAPCQHHPCTYVRKPSPLEIFFRRTQGVVKGCSRAQGFLQALLEVHVTRESTVQTSVQR